MRVFGLKNIEPGGTLEEVEWSLEEKVWPFEKGPNGQTMYCKFVDFGTLPNNGSKSVAHGISAPFTVWKTAGRERNVPLNYAATGDLTHNQQIAFIITSEAIIVYTGISRTGTHGRFNLIYYYI